ncbi:hypothetical protein [Natronoglomus mannanivorans]|uniref:Uncharacterized protein n=1 Tax=Natronoglomus mannanivorans TaxID=2979990 RepID=A0AAP3E3G7_9EURY|nr:hypothetical protein [Halobacteria archaeon AArc-xg1-1]
MAVDSGNRPVRTAQLHSQGWSGRFSVIAERSENTTDAETLEALTRVSENWETRRSGMQAKRWFAIETERTAAIRCVEYRDGESDGNACAGRSRTASGRHRLALYASRPSSASRCET